MNITNITECFQVNSGRYCIHCWQLCIVLTLKNLFAEDAQVSHSLHHEAQAQASNRKLEFCTQF